MICDPFLSLQEQRQESKSDQAISHLMKPTATGLLLIGTERGCGKTVFLTGLAATLKEQGFSVNAIKPIQLGLKETPDAELTFISSVTRTPINYSTQYLPSSGKLNLPSLKQAVLFSHDKAQLTLIELPGSCAAPICIDEEKTDDDKSSAFWKDACDLAKEFNLPCLIVAKHAEDALEKLILASTYLKAHKLTVIALATVETEANLGSAFERMTRAEVELALFARTQVNYIGCVKYSPSISVPRGAQGNLIKMTLAGIDLLVLIKELNLAVPTGQQITSTIEGKGY
jgi:dethiobiotin synthetase